MIRVTRINHQPIVLNCDLIQSVETVPDTMIALINGQKLFVEESVEEIVDRVVEFRKITDGRGAVCQGTGVPAESAAIRSTK
ncbi:MAG: flagellar FlbD family protein [Acidobacteriota bacterium]